MLVLCVCLFGRDWDTVAPPGFFFAFTWVQGGTRARANGRIGGRGARLTWHVVVALRRPGGVASIVVFFFLTSNAVLECGGGGANIGGSFFLRRKTMRE